MIKEAYFAGGCFWCITPIFKETEGVLNVYSGYCGGDEIDPSYEDVKKQKTKHRETIFIEYDDEYISYGELVNIFIENVDIYDGEGQYIDRGYSYTLAIYYKNNKEKEICETIIKNLKKSNQKEIYVSIEPYKCFYVAEEYHQDYYLKHPKEFEEELISSGRKRVTND